jgi:hypothetical protein
VCCVLNASSNNMYSTISLTVIKLIHHQYNPIINYHLHYSFSSSSSSFYLRVRRMDWYGTLEEHSTHSIEAECTQVTEGRYVHTILSFFLRSCMGYIVCLHVCLCLFVIIIIVSSFMIIITTTINSSSSSSKFIIK